MTGLRKKARDRRRKESAGSEGISKIQNKELLKASKKAFDGSKASKKELKSFLETYGKLKAQGRLLEQDKKAVKRISRIAGRKMEKGEIEIGK